MITVTTRLFYLSIAVVAALLLFIVFTVGDSQLMALQEGWQISLFCNSASSSDSPAAALQLMSMLSFVNFILWCSCRTLPSREAAALVNEVINSVCL